jgi:hypothetical protein
MSELELVATPTAAVCARAFVTHTLQRWQLTELSERAEQLVHVLVDSTTATSGTRERLNSMWVRLSIMGHSLIVEVWDGDITPPELANETNPNRHVLESLSKRWNYFHPRSGGKTVWCELDLPGPGTAQNGTAVLAARPSPAAQQSFSGGTRPADVAADPEVLRRVWHALNMLSEESAGGVMR